MSKSAQYILWLSEIDNSDLDLVGKHSVLLSELKQNEIPIPNGFVITTKAYLQFINDNNLQIKIKHLLSTLDNTRPESLHQISLLIKRQILNSDFSSEMVKEIYAAYKKLNEGYKNKVVRINSQIITENSHHDMLSEQNGLKFEINGETNILVKLKESWAEIFSAKRLAFRIEKNINHFSTLSSMLIQQTIYEQKSGYIYTADPISDDKAKIVISAVLGNIKYLSANESKTDFYHVAKKDMMINKKEISNQAKLFLRLDSKSKEITVPKNLQNSQKISDKEILNLAKIGKKLEHILYFPQQCEWAIADDKFYILKLSPFVPQLTNVSKTKTLGIGQPVFPGIATGPILKIQSENDYKSIKSGEIVLITKISLADKNLIKKAGGIICLQNTLTKQDASHLRSFNKPTVAADEKALESLKNGQIISINGTKGEFYKGGFLQNTNLLNTTAKKENVTATKLFITLNDLDQVESIAKNATDGVGLLTAETVFLKIGKHPKAYIQDRKSTEYIDLLANQLEKVLKAFAPRPVIYMIGDIKTEGFKKLSHGKSFEIMESNPLLGFHGAYRAVNDPHVIKMEIEAVKQVRNKLNLRNIWVMLPFVRNVHEFTQFKKLLSSEGLHRSPTFKIWLSLSLPANIFLLDKYLENGIDGISLDIEELTMLTLGLDINNDETIRAFNFEDEAMFKIYEHITKTAGKMNIPLFIHSRNKNLSNNLIENFIKLGATALTVQPQSFNSTKDIILDVEKKLISGIKK